MEVKNHLFLENKKMLAILKKKEQVERQRKHILKSEFREIDRIEKVIDRLQWTWLFGYLLHYHSINTTYS